ncbi:hypothetical protein M758_UG311500 [Ceratodon purpureus]|nr:hypothetical protein M758_UG311500 [Ceratodon purpureus]
MQTQTVVRCVTTTDAYMDMHHRFFSFDISIVHRKSYSLAVENVYRLKKAKNSGPLAPLAIVSYTLARFYRQVGNFFQHDGIDLEGGSLYVSRERRAESGERRAESGDWRFGEQRAQNGRLNLKIELFLLNIKYKIRRFEYS